MAEVNTEGGGKKKGKKHKTKKQSTRIDLTPMVDLGFLLITFFMLTTTLSKPQTMEINMPVKDQNAEDTKVKASTAMTIILSKNDRIFYYFGIPEEGQELKMEVTNFGDTGIRKLLLEKNAPQIAAIEPLKAKFERKEITEDEYRKAAIGIKGSPNALVVLIKSDDKSKYKNLVDILDEMNICNIGKYAIVDISPVEQDLIKNL